MEPLQFDLDCPNCGDQLVGSCANPEDDTITCSCGYGFALRDVQRAEADFLERSNEIMEIHSEILVRI